MQVYRHMNTGTAKPGQALRQRAPHHLIDIVEPTERFTVADWLGRADPLINRLLDSGKTPIVVGGTNLYIKVLLEGMFDGPPHNAKLRSELEVFPTKTLHHRLSRVDARAATRIHPNDRKRLVRALEVYHLTGQPISHLQAQWHDHLPSHMGADFDTDQFPSASSKLPGGISAHTAGTTPPMSAQRPTAASYRYDPVLIGLDWPVNVLNRRINRRVKAMFYPEKASGLIREQLNITESLPTEVRRLAQSRLLGHQSSEAIGYKQVMDFICGRRSLSDAFEQTKILTRRLAKQQRTWLRRFHSIYWLKAGEGLSVQNLADAINILKS